MVFASNRRLLTWASVDVAAISLLLAIASFVVIDSTLIGVLALSAAVLTFSAFLFLSRSDEEPQTQAGGAENVEHGVPFHPITGLHNWWVFRERATHEIARAQRHGRILAILLLEPGDLLASPTDEARANAADVLRRTIRDGDYGAHYDESRFVLMLPETDSAGAKTAANRLLTNLRAAQDPPMAWRAALVAYPKHGAGPDQLLAQAQTVLQPGRQENAAKAG